MSTDKENIETQSFLQKNGWIKKAIIILIIVAAGYFIFNLLPDNFEKSSAFTQYEELQDTVMITSLDTSTDVIDTMVLSKLDTLSTVHDTLATEGATSTASDSVLIEGTRIDSTESDSFKIDESYKFGSGESTNSQQFGGKNSGSSPNGTHFVPQKKDLFDELFLPSNPIDTSQIRHQQFFTKKTVSSKTILKILANVGKIALLNENSQNATAVFESIVEEDNMVEILLVNRLGEIIYSTNKQFLNENIQNVFPGLNTNNNVIEREIGEKQFLTSVAIYHTYGQIGNVILVTK